MRLLLVRQSKKRHQKRKMKETLSLVDLLFNHKTKQVSELLGGEQVGKVYRDVDSTLFSLHRRPSAKKEIKSNGAIRLLDHLYANGTAVMYINSDPKTAYCEFEANGQKYHMLRYPSGTISVAEEELGCRYHKLFAFCMEMALENESIFNTIKSIKLEPSEARDRALGFCDEFYYYGIKEMPELEIELGDKSVMSQAEVTFQSGVFSNAVKYGNGPSDFDSVASEEKPKPSKKKKDGLWEDIKAGKYILDYKWPEEEEAFITDPSFLESYIPDNNFFRLFNSLKTRLSSALARVKEAEKEGKMAYAMAKDVTNCFVIGRPGTGKTYMLYALSAAFGIPLRFTNVSKNSEEDTFEGMSKVIDGKLTEVATDFVHSAKKGGIHIAEELKLGDPGVIEGVMNQFCEFPFVLKEQGYKPVRRHALSILFATFNTGEDMQLNDLATALSTRFSETLVIDDPSKEDLIERLVINGYDKKAATWVYGIYSDLLYVLTSPDYVSSECADLVTFRSCLSALRLMSEGVDGKEAIEQTMVNKVAERDLDIAKKLKADVLDSAVDFSM